MVKIHSSYGANKPIPALWAARNHPILSCGWEYCCKVWRQSQQTKQQDEMKKQQNHKKTPAKQNPEVSRSIYSFINMWYKKWLPFSEFPLLPKSFQLCLPIYRQMACVDTTEKTQLKKRNTGTTLTFQISHYIYIVIDNDVKTQKIAHSLPSSFQEFPWLPNYSNFTRPLP